jgi:hypothetical protein
MNPGVDWDFSSGAGTLDDQDLLRPTKSAENKQFHVFFYCNKKDICVISIFLAFWIVKYNIESFRKKISPNFCDPIHPCISVMSYLKNNLLSIIY